MIPKIPSIFYWASIAGTTVGGLVLFRENVIAGKAFDVDVNLSGKVAIVTGGYSGIGKEVVHDLAKRGAKVYIAGRDKKKCEEARKELVLGARNKYVYCRQCDLASQKSIFEFVRSFSKDNDQLDLLIDNAGVMRCPQSLTEDGIEMQLGVNHMGHFLLTNLLLDKLKKTPHSRIVIVSSIAHTRGTLDFNNLNFNKDYDPKAAYNQSKLCNILFMKRLSKDLAGSPSVFAVHPGIVNTNIARHMGIANSFVSKVFIGPFIWLFTKHPRHGAQTVLYAALHPELDGQTGKYFSNCSESDVSSEANDPLLAEQLWLTSERWTNLAHYRSLLCQSQSR